MEWNVSSTMVEALLAENVPGIDSKLKALLVFQHCSVHNLSLFDFLSRFRVDGLRVVPIEGLPVSRPSPALVEDLLEDVPQYRHSNWRDEPLSVDRLEKLRVHLQEVTEFAAAGFVGSAEYVQQLKASESQLARVVEPVPTLGMVADDAPTVGDEEPELSSEVESDPEPAAEASSEPLPVFAPSSEAEQAEIAAVLANPKAAQPVAAEPRKDAAGRLLVSDARLEEIYAEAERLGMNRVQAQGFLCEKNNVRRVEDLSEVVAEKILKKMKARSAAC
jgi:hypothetical protein